MTDAHNGPGPCPTGAKASQGGAPPSLQHAQKLFEMWDNALSSFDTWERKWLTGASRVERPSAAKAAMVSKRLTFKIDTPWRGRGAGGGEGATCHCTINPCGGVLRLEAELRLPMPLMERLEVSN